MKRILPVLICLLATLTLGAQSHPNGLLMDSFDPAEDSVAIARVRARMDSIRRYRPTVAVVLADKDNIDLAVGIQYGRKTVLGPLKVSAHWCNSTGFGMAFSFGLDF